MPMERSVSCAERGSVFGGGADIRSYSASYARPAAAAGSRVRRARSVSSWTRPAPQPRVERSGSAKSGVAGRPAPGGLINLRSYSASYAASYGPTLAADGAGAGGGQLRRSGSVTSWSAANRRSVNLRGYTPSFAALDGTAAGPAASTTRKAAAGLALDDAAELQRRRRLVVYKTYDVEGKVRDSMRRSVSWIKGKCSRAVYGWW
ncbi:hypothetical protein U9M48_025160 [Paspalum notatum var. saurae]|uniref:Uncharacterized protein n=1 Tax=Paspalum notatum var. saurae TaxID=547442 RepID=A0AAQ3TNR0_PASNO